MSKPLPVHNVPGYPTEYRGWRIYRWTGWKARYGKIAAPRDIQHCHYCQNPIAKGSLMALSQSMPDAHWFCAYPHDREEEYYGQWLAVNNNPSTPGGHVYASARGQQGSCLPGGTFDINAKGAPPITDATSESDRAAAQAECFERLKLVIDGIEDTQ